MTVLIEPKACLTVAVPKEFHRIPEDPAPGSAAELLALRRSLMERDRDTYPARVHRRGLFLKAHGRCVYCDRGVNKKTMTIDHWWPSSMGGPDSMLNAVPACQRCNSRKSNRVPTGMPKHAPSWMVANLIVVFHQMTGRILLDDRFWSVDLQDVNWATVRIFKTQKPVVY